MNKEQLFEQIDNNELDAVFDTLEKNKAIFKGFQDLRDRFIYDNPKGVELQRFKQALKAFIGSKLEREAEVTLQSLLGVDLLSRSKLEREAEVTPEPQDKNLIKVIEIRQLIAQGRLSEALKILPSILPAHLRNEALQLQRRLSDLERENRMGIISSADAGLERNKITSAVLDLLSAENLTPSAIGLSYEKLESISEMYSGSRDFGDANFNHEKHTPSKSSGPALKDVSKKKSGVILYSIPSNMQINNLHRCIIRIGFDKKTILKNLPNRAEDAVLKEDIRVEDNMEVTFQQNPYFSITALNSTRQVVEKGFVTEWNFDVRPLTLGRFPLTFIISVVLKTGTRQVVLTESIIVGIEPAESSMEFIMKDISEDEKIVSENDTTRSETPPETRDIGDGKNEKPLIYNNKDVMEVPMATDAREFIPFKDIKEPIKILFLAAGQLNTGKESRFKDLIHQFDKKERFLVNEEHGLSPEQFQNHLIFENPYIVHYGGHGFREGIVLEGASLAADVLTEILKLSENTQCVILNACNTLPIARSIAQHIPYAIGTQAPIDDKAAIAFARGFYMGIVAGKTIEAAFKSGILAIRAANLPDAGVPVLVRMEGYKTKATVSGV